MLLCSFVFKKAGLSGRKGIQDCALATAACKMSSQGISSLLMSAGRREIGQGSSWFSAPAVQHKDIISQAAARAFSEISERTERSSRKALEMITNPPYILSAGWLAWWREGVKRSQITAELQEGPQKEEDGLGL